MKLLGFLLVGSAAAFAPVVPFYTNNRLVRSSSTIVCVDFKGQSSPLFYVSHGEQLAEAKADSKPNNLIYPPFLITNIKTEPIPGHEDEGEVTFVNGESESDEGKFLYDIHKREHDYYAKSTIDIDKVRDLLDGHKHHILLYMHGFREDAQCALQYCTEYNSQAKRKYLVVPILWNTVHKESSIKELLLYNYDRRNCVSKVAPALKDFLELMLKDQEHWKHKYSLMCHSMGNYILGIVAQLRGVHAQGDIDPRGDVFENVFMVAADVREDIFDERLNNYDSKLYPTLARMEKLSEKKLAHSVVGNANRVIDLMGTSLVYCTRVCQEFVDSTIMKRTNPGLDIASLAKNKVYVLWSGKDQALRMGALWKMLFVPRDDRIDQDGRTIPSGALGRNGNRRHQLHDKLKDKVLFKNCDMFSPAHPYKHSYQWDENAVEIYENATLIG